MMIVGDRFVDKLENSTLCSVTKIFQSKLNHLMCKIRSRLMDLQVVAKIKAKHSQLVFEPMECY
jgi:hypothetical protein